MVKKILYIGCTKPGQTSYERMTAMRDLGYEVSAINTCTPLGLSQRVWQKATSTLGMFTDPLALNRSIREHMRRNSADIIWVDKGLRVKASTLQWVKQGWPDCILVHLNPDDPFGQYRKGWKIFLEAIPHYDIHFVARTQNQGEFAEYGARCTIPYDRSYSKHLHRPLTLSPEEQQQFEVPVGFVGSHAPDRADMIAFLIDNGIPVAVYGNGWQNKSNWNTIKPHYRGPSRFGIEYTKIINGMGIALHFLRHENRDEQDSRTFEIPACGVFMLAERSPKHEELFLENREAVFFSSREELIEKVRYYLQHPEQAKEIAQAGLQRCLTSGYDHHSRMKSMLGIINRGEKV